MFTLKHVLQQCQNTSCLGHPITCLTTAVQQRASSPHLFLNIFWGPLRKLEHSLAGLVWTPCYTLTTNVVQIYPCPNTNLSSTGGSNKIMVLWKVAVFEYIFFFFLLFGNPSLAWRRTFLLFACQSLVWSTARLNYSWGWTSKEKVTHFTVPVLWPFSLFWLRRSFVSIQLLLFSLLILCNTNSPMEILFGAQPQDCWYLCQLKAAKSKTFKMVF